MPGPMISTFGLGKDPFSFIVYGNGPANAWNEICTGPGGVVTPPTVTLGASVPATGQTLAAGQWLEVTTAGVATLVTSNGTAVAPSSGTVHTVSAA